MGLVVVLMDSAPDVPGAVVPAPVGPEGKERVDATSLLSYALKLRRDISNRECDAVPVDCYRGDLAGIPGWSRTSPRGKE